MSHVSHGAEDIDERPCSHGAMPQTLPIKYKFELSPMSQTMDTVHQMRGGGRVQPRTLEPQETLVYDYSDRSRETVISHVSHGAEDIDERPCSHGAMPQTMDTVYQVRGGGRAQPWTLEPQKTCVCDYSGGSGVIASFSRYRLGHWIVMIGPASVELGRR